MLSPTIDQLQRAVVFAEQIEKLEAELASILGSKAVTTTPASAKASAIKSGRKKGKMSAEGRARIIAAQKARWAKIKGEKTAIPAAAAPKAKMKAKRIISPEARAKMAAAAKRRWANKK